MATRRMALLVVVPLMVATVLIAVTARTSEAEGRDSASIAGTPPACGDDSYEQNDARDDAPPLLQPVEIENLASCPNDTDWFMFHLFAGDHITIDAFYSDSNGDLNLSLYGQGGGFLTTATPVSASDQRVDFYAPASGIYYVRIDPSPEATQGIDYTLRLSGNATPTPTPPLRTPTPVPLLDLNGDWSLNLYPDDIYSGSCFLYLVRSGDSLSGALGCYGFRPVRVAGYVNIEKQSYALSWSQFNDSFNLTDQWNDDARGTIVVSSAPEPVPFDMYRIGSVWGNPDCDFSPSIGPLGPPPDSGAVNALLVLQHAANLATRELPCLSMSDVNLDGQIDARDATLILQHEAGLIRRLPVL